LWAVEAARKRRKSRGEAVRNAAIAAGVITAHLRWNRRETPERPGEGLEGTGGG